MPLFNGNTKEAEGEQQKKLPAVRRGEKLNVWLRRAIPALVDGRGMGEDEAREAATAAWNKVNAQGKFAGDKEAEAESAEAPAEGDGAAEEASAEAEKEAEAEQPAEDEKEEKPETQQRKPDQEMEWEKPSSWQGKAEGEEAQAGAEEGAEGEQPEDPTPQEDSLPEWFANQIAGFADTLLDHLVANGYCDDTQAKDLLIAASDLSDELYSRTAQTLAPAQQNGQGNQFAFAVPLPAPTQFFGAAGAARPNNLTPAKSIAAAPYIKRFAERGPALPESLAIKALQPGRVGAYLCLWGDPTHKDLSGEWFAPDTQEMTSIFKAVGTIPAIYHHALDNAMKATVVGLVDVMEPDSTGLWIEAQIKEHDAYQKLIAPLVNKGMLGWSSGALPGGRRVDRRTGKVTRWPIVEASMTPTPMEWRMAAEHPIQHIKGIYRLAGLPVQAVANLDGAGKADGDLDRTLTLIRLLELSNNES